MTTPSRSSLVSLLIPYANSSLFDVREQNVCVEKDGRRGTVHFESNLVKTGNPVKTGKASAAHSFYPNAPYGKVGDNSSLPFGLQHCFVWLDLSVSWLLYLTAL